MIISKSHNQFCCFYKSTVIQIRINADAYKSDKCSTVRTCKYFRECICECVLINVFLRYNLYLYFTIGPVNNSYESYDMIYLISSSYANFKQSISLLNCKITTVNHLHQRSRQKHICTQCDLSPNQWRVQSKNLQWKRISSSYIADQESLPNKRFEWLSEKLFDCLKNMVLTYLYNCLKYS